MTEYGLEKVIFLIFIHSYLDIEITEIMKINKHLFQLNYQK